MQEQRVAVGLGPGDARGTKRATSATHVFDDHLLAQILVMGSAINRPTVSVEPPAANGTIIVIVSLKSSLREGTAG